MLRGFAGKDMIEQIVMLEEIKDNGRVDLLPDLMELYATPQADLAVDEIVYHTLFALLGRDTNALVNALGHGSPRVRLVAVRRAGEDQPPAALPILLDQLKTTAQAELLTAIIFAVSQYHDPALSEALAPFAYHSDDTVAAFAREALEELDDKALR